MLFTGILATDFSWQIAEEHEVIQSATSLKLCCITIKCIALVPAIYLRKAGPTLKITILSQLSSVGRTTSSFLVPTEIPGLAVYVDFGPQCIQASVEGSAGGVSEV